jgi:hypothetical protein
MYGKSTLRRNGKAPLTAAEVIRGRYKEEERLPDPDLGKSLTPGFRNITYGVSERVSEGMNDYISKLQYD